MTAKEKRFGDEFLLDMNYTQAAIRAGYSKARASEQAYQLLQKTTVQKYLSERMSEKESELIADQDEVLKYLTSVLRGKSTSSVLARDEIGAERVIEKPPDEKERLKAAELLGKRYGLYTDKVDLDADAELHICIDYGESSE